MDKTVTKCVFKDGVITLEWDETNERTKSIDSHRVTSEEAPLEGFLESFIEMKAHLNTLCEFPGEEASKLTLLSVSIVEKEGTLSVVLAGIRKLEGAKAGLALKTPLYSYSTAQDDTREGDLKNVMPEDCYLSLLELQKQCVVYIDGDRQQLNLFEKKAV